MRPWPSLPLSLFRVATKGHYTILFSSLLLRRSAQLHLLSVITFPNLSSSLPLSLSLSFSCNQQEGEHNTTRTYYYCQRKITDPIPRWSVREKQRERRRERERDKRERAIRVSAEIRDGILIRQVSRSLAPSLFCLSLSSLHLWPWLAWNSATRES